jgi:hypothetical protein
MTTNPLQKVERVNYATGMMLSADDFRAEQDYHRSRLAQILRYALGKGTLAGLAVESGQGGTNPVSDANYTVFVRPGLAIDGLGQLIEVPRDYSISLKRWVETNPDKVSAHVDVATNTLIVDVSLSARDIGRAKTPSFADGPFDALDAIVASRLEDSFVLHLDLVMPGLPPPIVPVLPSPLNQVLASWKIDTESTVVKDQKIFLGRIDKCPVVKNNPAGQDVPVFTIPPGQALQIKNDLRSFIQLTGRAPVNS